MAFRRIENQAGAAETNKPPLAANIVTPGDAARAIDSCYSEMFEALLDEDADPSAFARYQAAADRPRGLVQPLRRTGSSRRN